MNAKQRQQKLQTLAEAEGFDEIDEFLVEFMLDSTCPGICTSQYCDATTDVEPDQREGWCHCCETNTVQSGLVLAGVV